MNLKTWLKNWHIDNLKINAKFLEAELSWEDADRNAAWELYVELLTRTATQKLPDEQGDENRALESIYELFEITREIIKRNGRKCIHFTKIAIIVLNQIIRPFTTKWHNKLLNNPHSKDKEVKDFRIDLQLLQSQLIIYTQMLANMAEVEDLTSLQKNKNYE